MTGSSAIHQKRRRRRQQPGQKAPSLDGDKQPYGFVLILRALASHAMSWPEYPASLRVLNVLAMSMNQDGVCRVGQHSIADRLGVTRQAVNKQLGILERCGTVIAVPQQGPGRTKTYALDLDRLEREKPGQDIVEELREERRLARKKCASPATSSPDQLSAKGTPDDELLSPLANTFGVGSTVSHVTFGVGQVTDIDDNKITVEFPSGSRRVVRSFLEVVV